MSQPSTSDLIDAFVANKLPKDADVAACRQLAIAAVALINAAGTELYSLENILRKMKTAVTDGSNAGAGEIGEYFENFDNGTTLTPSHASQTLCTIALPPGDWDITGYLDTLCEDVAFNLPQFPIFAILSLGGQSKPSNVPYCGDIQFRWPLPTFRYSSGSSGSVSLTVSSNLSAGSISANGLIRARRVR